jgi:exonuclease SbcC
MVGMSDLALREIEVTNFRSIRGRLTAPLDANVVLIHGENGSGKTSLLSAIELAFTGGIQSLRRFDQNYMQQLLHRSAEVGSVSLRVKASEGPEIFRAILNSNGVQVEGKLNESLGAYFSERSYLPQSMLGQLLQIYQESGSGIDSPLARFVGDLMGLDRLDAIEAGLRPLADVRNLRKLVDRWGQVEAEGMRLERVLTDKLSARFEALDLLTKNLNDLNEVCVSLGIAENVTESTLDMIDLSLATDADETRLAHYLDWQSRLDSIRREAERNENVVAQKNESELSAALDAAILKLKMWRDNNEKRIEALRARVRSFLTADDFSQDIAMFREQALQFLRRERGELSAGSIRNAADAIRLGKARDELVVAERHLATIDEEIGLIGEKAGGIGSVLAELSSYLVEDICPVCDRNFREVNSGALTEHLHAKVRHLTSSADRLLSLSRLRVEQQLAAERLKRELETSSGRQIASSSLADLARKIATIDEIIADLDSFGDAADEGSRLTDAEVTARRQLAEYQSRDLASVAALQTLQEFALMAGQPVPLQEETVQSAAFRLSQALYYQVIYFSDRTRKRSKGRELVALAQKIIDRRHNIDGQIALDRKAVRNAEQALARGQALRQQGLAIRTAVDKVRSQIIRREFNDRLNRLWRDLFVRLAPTEPFVPAFRIPTSHTLQLQPKLVTEHRDGGDAGGAPGSMLSSGNLNTAALTLFIALHLSVPAQLPWLILDDPIQSMDDVHIAHLAALLRTLSKEHGRQVMIAVHDRQLFDYLKLELSPAYPYDRLLTLELSRSTRRDTMCIAERLSFKEEMILHQAA